MLTLTCSKCKHEHQMQPADDKSVVLKGSCLSIKANDYGMSLQFKCQSCGFTCFVPRSILSTNKDYS